MYTAMFFFFSSRRRHTRFSRDWSSDVCSSDLLLGMSGYRALILEKDIHPRDHVGESITPSTNPIWARIGFLDKIEDAGFVHKPGACWTAPRAPAGRFLAIHLGEFPPPGATQLHTYNVERDVFDSMLLRHAHELGAEV